MGRSNVVLQYLRDSTAVNSESPASLADSAEDLPGQSV